tara:strand:+ start:148 stop:2001 length:1854 start_codon:yes stop_codon:yes gene_type:complete
MSDRMEIRIYCESMEQAHHYMLPILQRAAPAANIECIYAPGSTSWRRISRKARNAMMDFFYYFSTPDGMITIVEDGVEKLLCIIEFSESVVAEDHEYQRSAGVFPCAVMDVVYLKIAGHKTTEGIDFTKRRGGRVFSPLSVTRAFQDKVGYFGYFMAEWATLKNDTTTLDRHEKYPSVPNNGACPLFSTVIAEMMFQIDSGKRPGSGFTSAIYNSVVSETLEGQEFKNRVQNANSVWELNDMWANASARGGIRRWHGNGEEMYVHIYRFGHGMDPDRGCLQFVSTFCDEEKVFARFTGAKRVSDKKIQSGLIESIFGLRGRFQYLALHHDKGLSRGMINAINNAEISSGNSIDITDWMKDNLSKMSKPTSALALFSDGIVIHDYPDGEFILRVTWDRSKILDCPASITLDHLYSRFNQYSGADILPLDTAKPREDPVAYTFVHSVAPKLGWDIHSASYPGAQGSVGILPDDPRKGRQRPRIYCDGIASEQKSRGILFEAKDTESASISPSRYGPMGDLSKLSNLCNEQFDAVSASFQKIGIKLEKRPLAICGFISQNHVFEREVFAEYVDLVMTLDWDTKTWKLHDLHGNKYDCEGVVSLPPMLDISFEHRDSRIIF